MLSPFTSCTGNNGSAFAGLTANTMFYNSTLGLAMFIGRFLMIVPMLAIAGSLGAQKMVGPSAGALPEDRAAVRRPLPHRWWPVCRAADRRHRHHWRPDLLPRPGAGTDRRT